MTLPHFTYHPDPIASGSLAPSDAVCRACNQARGFIYVGAPYAEEALDDAICPWCIADGSAANKFDAEFVDSEGIGGYGMWDEVPQDVIDEVALRTPGFAGWQQERWWTHCGDAAEFLGRAGCGDLQGKWLGAVDAIQQDAELEDEEWDDYFESLDSDASPTAYVFRCRHCGALGGYSDAD